MSNQLKTEDVVFVENHQILLSNYLYDNYQHSYEHREYIESLFLDWENATATRTILEDYKKTNKEKIKYFLDKLKIQSLIISVVADRGQGKTAFSVWLLEQISKQTTKKIYALFPFPKLPFIEEVVYDISQVPTGSILYIDEVAKKYKSRDFSSEDALAMTDELIGLRHNDISVIGSTQDLALIDVNFIRLSDIVCWKYYNMEKAKLSRTEIPITEVMLHLMPKRDKINDVLINDRGELSTLNFPFSDYSKETSHHLSSLRNSKPEIINFLSKYHEKKDLIKILHTQYNIKLTLKEQKELIYQSKHNTTFN